MMSLMPQVRERRHAAYRGFDVRHEAFEVALEQALAEPVRHAIGKARRRAFFVGTEDPAHALLAQVIGLIGFAQHRELAAAALAIGLQLRRLLEQDVLVLDRDRRHVEPKHATGLARVVSGRANHVLGDDVALVRRRLAIHPTGVRVTPVTSVRSLISAPPARAPLRSAMVRSAGAMCPSSG